MTPLSDQRVLALGAMRDRPLARYLASLGAAIIPVDALAETALTGASFLIDDLGLDRLADAGWPQERIAVIAPALVHASVTTFGSGGPRARWRGGELVASAMGGALRVTGDPDRRPVKEALDACAFHADMVAGAGMMAAHYARGSHGSGQHVDISIQQVAFSRNYNGVLVWQFDRRKLARVGGALSYGKATVKCIWKLADGWCFHSLMTGRLGAPANQALSDWMDETRVPNPLHGTDWLAYDRSALDPAIRAEWEAAIAHFFSTRSRAEMAREGVRRGINACVVNEPADVLSDPHLAARDFFVEAGGVRDPGRFAKLREGQMEAEKPLAHPSTRRGPLAGVRVLDFAWALVGAITTKTLGDLGAEIVKIETRSRPDLARLDVQVTASQHGNLDDKPWFAHLNSSKKSLSLDMKNPAARAILDPLIDWADVVVENFSPGTMAKLGLDYDSLAARNPGLVMVSGSVFGQDGPMARQWGVDGTGGALSGRTFLTGWPDRDPVTPGAVPYGDVIVPYVMAGCVAAGLQHRRETGRGSYIDAAMYEICVQQTRPAILGAQQGLHPDRAGNADAGVLQQEIYPCRGDDRWIAISLFHEADRNALSAITGPDISAWTSTQVDHDAAALLQAAGIAAGVVQDAEDMIECDPQLATREALVTLDHPILGPFGHIATPIRFSRDTFEPFRAPRMGEHYAEVAASICGLDEAQIANLFDQGVFK